MVITVIEEASAVENIDEIAATPGVDVLFIGTSDLSFSLGLRGRQNEPLLDEAIDKVVAAAKRHGKFLGRPVGTGEQVPQVSRTGIPVLSGLDGFGTDAYGCGAVAGESESCGLVLLPWRTHSCVQCRHSVDTSGSARSVGQRKPGVDRSVPIPADRAKILMKTVGELVAHTLVCRVDTPVDASGSAERRASTRVSTRHAGVRAPRHSSTGLASRRTGQRY